MTAPEDLLAEIWAQPEDDAPRLVYADYLVERGDPRGEFIQLQIALEPHRWDRDRARYPTDPDPADTRELIDREQALMRAHGEMWNAPFHELGASAHFRRGFPHLLIAQGAAFLAAKHLIGTEPIREITFIADLKPEIRAIASVPELDRIRRIDLGGSDYGGSDRAWSLGDAGLAALADAWLPSLRELAIGHQAIGVAGAKSLARARWLDQLEVLVLAANPILSEGVVALAPHLANLRHLDLHDTGIEDPALHAIGRTNPSRLAWLRVSCGRSNPPEHRTCSRLSPDAARALCDGFGALRHVDLSGNWFADEGTATLARAPLPALVELCLRESSIGDDGAIALATSPARHALELLDLANNAIHAPGGAALAASTTLASLRELRLYENYLGPEGVTALATATGLPALRELWITHNKVFTGEIDTSGEVDVEVDESYAALKARFAGKPHWHIS